MGTIDLLGKGAIWAGKKLISKTPDEAAKDVGLQFLKNYKPGTKLPKILRKYMKLENKPGWLKKVLKLAGIGGGAIGGEKYLSSRWEKAKKLDKAKGGSVRRMNAGGSVSRGTGAAKRGTKFKGVF